MTGRAPRGWWEYAAALRELAPNDGAWATGAAWAEACWTWRKGATEDEVLRTTRQLSLKELGARYRPRVAERTLRLHFRQLVTAGLLELVRGHGRGRPNTYAPRVPVSWRAGITGNTLPVKEGKQRQHVAGIPGAMTGNTLPDDRHLVATAPFSPETIQTPHSRTRDRAHARVSPEQGRLTPEERQTAERTLEVITAAMPGDAVRALDPEWAGRLLEAVAVLRTVGWLPGQLATEVSRKAWSGVVHPSSVLVKRLARLVDQPSPAASSGRRPQWCTECDYDRRLRYDEAGNPDPSQPCPVCHPGAVQLAAAGGVAL